MDHPARPTLETTDLDDLSNLNNCGGLDDTDSSASSLQCCRKQMDAEICSPYGQIQFATHKYRLSNYGLYSAYRFWF